MSDRNIFNRAREKYIASGRVPWDYIYMCGRFDFHDLTILPERYRVEIPKDARPSYNIAPTQKTVVINRERSELKSFGIPAPWDKKKPLINARVETVADKPSFKNLFISHRCLVPANGYYEWKKNKVKTPFYFRVKGEEVFSFAGICSEEGFAILTTEAGETMAPIHNREPVILDNEEEKEWLNPDTSAEQALKLLERFGGELEMREVSRAVNNPQNNAAALLEPIYRKRT